MSSTLIRRRDLDFLLFELLGTEALFRRPRFADHSRETVAAVLDTAYRIAEGHFAPHSRKADENEPRIERGKVVMIPEVADALRHFIDAGFMAATADYEYGGMQLPYTMQMVTSALFSAANIGTMGYPFLTMAAANLLRIFGTKEQRERYMRPMLEGRFFGTMALTEPQAGSSLADIRTTAVPAEDGSYRLTGNKIFISAGDHELSENIVHLVLARISGAPAGVKGISLFIVPKYLVNDDGSVGARNDVALAGLIHKMGYRGTTSTMLNFGEQGGAVGYLVGEPHKGLTYMFHMMNEARIAVGNGATALGYTAYLHSLQYAKERPQGRHQNAKSPLAPQIPIVEHADVRRMLLMQKAYVEGALALTLYAARLVDDEATAESEDDRAEAHDMLEILTPIVKSWPSQWCLEANFWAIQIHGGYGYTREYPVEQIYRDNRLNPIHEGTHGIQSLDLVGRKLRIDGGHAFGMLCRRIDRTLDHIRARPILAQYVAAFEPRLATTRATTANLLSAISQGGADEVIANASVYLEALGHVVVAWLWLEQAAVADIARERTGDQEEWAFYDGKVQACRYFLLWELPKIDAQLAHLSSLDRTWLSTSADSL